MTCELWRHEPLSESARKRTSYNSESSDLRIIIHSLGSVGCVCVCCIAGTYLPGRGVEKEGERGGGEKRKRGGGKEGGREREKEGQKRGGQEEVKREGGVGRRGEGDTISRGIVL